MFNVQAVSATLDNLTAYSERHGDENVSGLALKLSMTLPRSILNTLHPALQTTFFKIADPDLPLIFPEVESIAWSRELIGATVAIGYEDLFNSDPVSLAGTTVDKFRLALQNGGSVDVTLRVKCKPGALDVGRLYEWLQRDVLLTIEPPLTAMDEKPEAAPKSADEHSGALALDGVR